MERSRKEKIRINAFLALAGLGSRRSVESLVKDGRVSVNGKIVADLALKVDPQKDQIACDGTMIHSQAFLYVMLHKPRSYACTRKDSHMSKTIYDLLPTDLHHLSHAGRLDIDSEGMLLLSNDGDWLNGVIHPKHEERKIYHVEIAGDFTDGTVQAACRGVQSREEWLKVDSIKFLEKNKRSTLVQVELRQGKNREIRRIFGALHCPVIRLQRVGIGKLRLGNLKEGCWRYLEQKEIERLRN